MNCPKCGGTGYVPTNVFGVNGAIKCDFCDGTGVFITNNEEPQTNDEWRKTCSAEEFAEFLCYVGFENETIVRRFKSEWMEWLKQPHTKE